MLPRRFRGSWAELIDELNRLLPKEFYDRYYGIPKGIKRVVGYGDIVNIVEDDKVLYTYTRTVGPTGEYEWVLSGQPQSYGQQQSPQQPYGNPKHRQTVINWIKTYVEALGKKYEQKPLYAVEWREDLNAIELRTDGLIYDLLFAPGMADPFLIKTAYRIQEDFFSKLHQMGWQPELHGGGIIHIYKGR